MACAIQHYFLVISLLKVMDITKGEVMSMLLYDG